MSDELARLREELAESRALNRVLQARCRVYEIVHGPLKIEYPEPCEPRCTSDLPHIDAPLPAGANFGRGLVWATAIVLVALVAIFLTIHGAS